MGDAMQLPVEVRESAALSISAAGLPAAIERQAAAGGKVGRTVCVRALVGWLRWLVSGVG